MATFSKIATTPKLRIIVTGGDPGEDFAPNAGPEMVVQKTGQAAAATYVISKGLSYPLKSSIYRGILGLTEDAAGAVALVPVIKKELTSGYHEMQSLAAGTCQ